MTSDDWSQLLLKFLKKVLTIAAGIVFAWMGYRLFEGAAELVQVQACDHPNVLRMELVAGCSFTLVGTLIVVISVWRRE